MSLRFVKGTLAGQAHIIPQQYFVLTQGPRVGTDNMFNCMGLVIHAPTARIGCLAHIEAVTSTDAYEDNFTAYLMEMVLAMSKIAPLSTRAGGLQVGLFGRWSGPSRVQRELGPTPCGRWD